MDSVDIEVLRTAEQWRKAGRPVALGTIVKTWGSAPRPVGAMVAIRDDGQIAGSVSGGCVEGAVVTEALAILEGAERRIVTFGYSDDEAFSVGLTCGGTVHLFIEPLDW